MEYVIKVLIAMEKANLWVKTEKLFFYFKKVKYLEFIITPKGIWINPRKVKVI